MHIFLTGERGIGKTTVIRSFLELCGKKADGFVTYWEQCGSEQCLYLRQAAFGIETAPATPATPASPAMPAPARHLLAKRKAQGIIKPCANLTEVFDKHGSRIINNSGKYDFIVMDELGILEKDAHHFQKAVISCLNSNVPVLGVIKAVSSPFFDKLRAHPAVTLIEVTAANRAQLPNYLRESYLSTSLNYSIM